MIHNHVALWVIGILFAFQGIARLIFAVIDLRKRQAKQKAFRAWVEAQKK